MKKSELNKIVKHGESDRLEFKTSTAEIRSAFETICAFLNNSGGMVLIGVKDNGKIIGQDIAQNTVKDITREIKKIEPAVDIDIDYIKITDKKQVIVLSINELSHCPYTYDGRAYYRNGAHTVIMPQNQYEQLLIKRGQLNHSWEEFIADDYKISDLDHEEIYKTVSDGVRENRIPASAMGENVKKVLQRLKLIKDGKLKRAAVILYVLEDKLDTYSGQCMIKMARFKGVDKLAEFIDNRQVYGNAFKILEEADAFLRRHMPIASFFKMDQFKRIDTPILLQAGTSASTSDRTHVWFVF